MRAVLLVVALLLVGCGKHPAQQGIEDAFEQKKEQLENQRQSTVDEDDKRI